MDKIEPTYQPFHTIGAAVLYMQTPDHFFHKIAMVESAVINVSGVMEKDYNLGFTLMEEPKYPEGFEETSCIVKLNPVIKKGDHFSEWKEEEGGLWFSLFKAQCTTLPINADERVEWKCLRHEKYGVGEVRTRHGILAVYS